MKPQLGATWPLASPLFTSSVYTIPDLDTLDAINAGEAGFIYARDAHPNASLLAARLAQMEGGSWGLACGSGMAALSTAILANTSQGDLLFASDQLYGRTSQLLRSELTRFGLTTEFHDVYTLARLRESLQRRKPKLLVVETLSNPLGRVANLPELAALCAEVGCRLLVDNTFASPVLCKPLTLGADWVMESLTKIIGGQSDGTLGFLAGRHRDDRIHCARVMAVWGFSSSPFDCWVTERGLDTLTLRVQAASANALRLAQWLTQQPLVKRVDYPGLPEHPDHRLAAALLNGGFGHVLCLELPGGRDAVNRFIRASAMPLSPSLGHNRTTLSYPAGTSHRHDPPENRQRLGITEGLIRVSVGCEDWSEIVTEVDKALHALGNS